MLSSHRLLWALGAIVGLGLLLSACAGSPSVTDERPATAGVQGTSPVEVRTTPAADSPTLPVTVPAAATSPVRATRTPEETATLQPIIPTPQEPALTPDVPAGDRLPVFVEMAQSALLPDSPAQMPPPDGCPAGAFAYDPGNRLLLVPPSVQILPTTGVLVGLTPAHSPTRPCVSGELIQLPSSPAAPFSLIAVDAATGTLTLAYAGQTFDLRSGESRSFKQKGIGEPSVVEITTLTNHGPLAAIGLLPADPAGP